MPELDFDFQEFIDERKGKDDALAQAGAAYAYPADQKVLRTLARVSPVTLAVQAAVRLWKGSAGREILGSAVEVTPRARPEIYVLARECAERLHIALPRLQLVQGPADLVSASFGTAESPAIALNASLASQLRPEELRFLIGHECGCVQNGHVPYLTALYYLERSGNLFVRWIVKPAALALERWVRRAEITSDRAGLIGSGDLQASVSALCRLALGSPSLPDGIDPTALATLPLEGEAPPGAVGELVQRHPELGRRLLALRLFAETHFYLKASGRNPRENDGKSLAWCDARVKQVLAMFSGRDRIKAGD